MIQSDNGTEFKNYTLDEFLSDEGIKHQYAAPYTPQQNSVAERKNRTLMDTARTMMSEFKSPYNFWAEAINTACHASNRLYLRKGLNKTPYEILTGNKPNLKYFRVFGCKCFILKKGVRLSKFESRAHEGIFVGYATNSHAYRVLNKSNGLIEETSNVEFDENNGSQVEQSGTCDVGDEIPPQAIRRMCVGYILPVEEPLVAEGEGQCSTQVEPSPTQDPHASEEHSEGPQPDEQGQEQDQSQVGEEPPIDAQGQVQSPEQDQGQEEAQDQDLAHVDAQDDQLNAPQLSLEEQLERRAAKVASRLASNEHHIENILGSIKRGVSTRRQLANYCAHQAFVSCVEPRKVYEALEDPDWLNAMHEELHNFERNKVWRLVPRQRRTIMSLEPNGSLRTIKMLMALSSATRRAWWLKA